MHTFLWDGRRYKAYSIRALGTASVIEACRALNLLPVAQTHIARIAAIRANGFTHYGVVQGTVYLFREPHWDKPLALGSVK